MIIMSGDILDVVAGKTQKRQPTFLPVTPGCSLEINPCPNSILNLEGNVCQTFVTHWSTPYISVLWSQSIFKFEPESEQCREMRMQDTTESLSWWPCLSLLLLYNYGKH